jgi:hypothetical protein
VADAGDPRAADPRLPAGDRDDRRTVALGNRGRGAPRRAGIVCAAAALVRLRARPERAARYAAAALVLGVFGGMLGAAALVGALILA